MNILQTPQQFYEQQRAQAMLLTPREAGMTAATGFQGTGKTFNTLRDIIRYLHLHQDRKALIFDPNGEYTQQECRKHGCDVNIPTLLLDPYEIQRFAAHQTERIRRITPFDRHGNKLNIQGMKDAMSMILDNFRKGIFLAEDMNKYLTNVRHVEDILSRMISLRHSNLDVILHLQSISKLDPTMWENVKYVRMHYQADNVSRIENRLPDYAIFKIAQEIINRHYNELGNKRFFLWIDLLNRKILSTASGLSMQEFAIGYYRYLMIDKTDWREMASRLRLDSKSEQNSQKIFNALLNQNGLLMYGK